MRVNVTDDGHIEGYLSTSEYAKEIGSTTANVRVMIERGKLDVLKIRAGDARNQCLNFIKEGTPKPTGKRGRKRKEN